MAVTSKFKHDLREQFRLDTHGIAALKKASSRTTDSSGGILHCRSRPRRL